MTDVDNRARRDQMGEGWLRRPVLKLASWQPIEATEYHVTVSGWILSLASLAIRIPEAASEYRLMLRGGTTRISSYRRLCDVLPHL